MESGAPKEQQFTLFSSESLPPEPRHEVAEAPSDDATDEASDLSPQDTASELKRRVAQVRAASRRTRTRAAAVTTADIVELTHVGTDLTTVRTTTEVVVVDFDDLTPDDGDFAEVRDDDALSIAEFYERVRDALAREFTDEIWVVGEIRNLVERRGHHYIELADVGAEVVGRNAAQQLEVACWARDWPRVAKELAQAGVDLEVGRVVRVRGRVSVWEGAGKLRFTLTAIDVEALLGGIAAARRKLLNALAEEGLLGANAALALPLVPLRIGLVTSPGSEAHRDFVGQLDRSGFAFDVCFEPSLVQGPEAPHQLAAALARLHGQQVDLAVVVRGGGARGDLAVFDAEELARAVATAPFPVWTGIGHTGDRSVADEVAHRSYITPTACGEAVVAEVSNYWDEIVRAAGEATRLARAQVQLSTQRLTAAATALMRSCRHQHDRRSDALRVAQARLRQAIDVRLALDRNNVLSGRDALMRIGESAALREEREAARCRQVLGAYDPRRQLERGWTLAHDEDGRLIRSVEQLKTKARMRTRFVDGEAISVVENVEQVTPNRRDERAPVASEVN